MDLKPVPLLLDHIPTMKIEKCLGTSFLVLLVGLGFRTDGYRAPAVLGESMVSAAPAGSLVVVTVAAATGAADLYPGFTGGDVHFTLTNDNPHPVTFTSMDAGTITSSNPTACTASNVSVADVASGLSLTVAADSTSGPLSIADVVTMNAGALDGCQGKSFTIALTLAGGRSS